MPETRYTYGAQCTWHGSIGETASGKGNLPVCPICFNVLFECTKEQWDEGVAQYAKENNESLYPDFINFLATKEGHSTMLDLSKFSTAFGEFKKSRQPLDLPGVISPTKEGQMWVNHKNGKTYVVTQWPVRNCTNAVDGQRMVGYKLLEEYISKTGDLFVREEEEFRTRFYLVKKD
jgi:hypothetical protein